MDANNCTQMPQCVIESMLSWCNAPTNLNESHAAILAFQNNIAEEYNISTIGNDGYTIMFTSGFAESNSYIVNAVVRSYSCLTNRIPHIITSEVEDESLLLCCEDLARDKLCQLAIMPVVSGCGVIDVSALAKTRRINTCLIAISSICSSTGAANDISKICEFAHTYCIPVYVDMTYSFGKCPIIAPCVDAFSASFHNLHGPPGVGILGIRNKLIDGYQLRSYVYGRDELRNGILPMHDIVAARAALLYTRKNRQKKNTRAVKYLRNILRGLQEKFTIISLDEYKSPDSENLLSEAIMAGVPIIVIMGQQDNIALIAISRRESTMHFSSELAKAALEKKNISIGLCSQRVLLALGVPHELQGATFCISVGDDIDATKCSLFIQSLEDVFTSVASLC